jgi:hypothetical protein
MRTSKIAAIGFLLFATACSSSSGAPTTDTPGSTGDSGAGETAATFTQVYTDLVSPICVECHLPSGVGVTDGKLDLSSQATAYTNLVGVAATGSSCNGMGTRVVAGDAAMSIFYTKVTTPTCGSKMPLGETALTSAQADEIEGWINAGAMNN